MYKSYDAVYNDGCKTNLNRTAVQMQCTENDNIFDMSPITYSQVKVYLARSFSVWFAEINIVNFTGPLSQTIQRPFPVAEV